MGSYPSWTVETFASQSSTPYRRRAWPIPAIIAALVFGLLIGIWWERRAFDSSDLVGIVSVLGSVGVAFYTMKSSRESERDRYAHERAMQAQQFREGRSSLHRDEAVRRLIELRRTLAPTGAFMFDFDRLAHGMANDDDQVADTREKLKEGLWAAAHGSSEVDWFCLIGWTPEIQRRADDLKEKLAPLIHAWGNTLSVYYHPSSLNGVTEWAELRDEVEKAWQATNVSIESLREALRVELAREPDPTHA